MRIRRNVESAQRPEAQPALEPDARRERARRLTADVRRTRMKVKKIRKDVTALTARDFELHPVWEFALDEESEPDQSETTMRPYEFTGPLVSLGGGLMVRARFVLADGTHMPGCLTLPTESDTSLAALQPVILAPRGHVLFWLGRLPGERELVAMSYALLERSSPSQVFPIRFESDVPLARGPLRGELPGFLVLDDLVSMRTRAIT